MTPQTTVGTIAPYPMVDKKKKERHLSAGRGSIRNGNEHVLRELRMRLESLFAARVSVILAQLNVPVEVVPPAEGCVFYADRHGDDGHPAGLCRLPDQPHLGFPRRPAPLLVVTAKACRHDIFPRSLTALHLGKNMVESQVLGGMLDATVLTGIFVPLIDVGAGEADFPGAALHFHQLEQTQDGGEFERDGHSADITIVEIDDFHLALGQQGDRPLPRYDL